MKVKIISPEKTIYESDISLMQLPGLDGSFEILRNHAPIISVLKKGSIRIIDSNQKEIFFEINSGVIEGGYNIFNILIQ